MLRCSAEFYLKIDVTMLNICIQSPLPIWHIKPRFRRREDMFFPTFFLLIDDNCRVRWMNIEMHSRCSRVCSMSLERHDNSFPLRMRRTLHRPRAHINFIEPDSVFFYRDVTDTNWSKLKTCYDSVQSVAARAETVDFDREDLFHCCARSQNRQSTTSIKSQLDVARTQLSQPWVGNRCACECGARRLGYHNWSRDAIYVCDSCSTNGELLGRTPKSTFPANRDTSFSGRFRLFQLPRSWALCLHLFPAPKRFVLLQFACLLCRKVRMNGPIMEARCDGHENEQEISD